MKTNHTAPATLLEAMQFFADPDFALDFFVQLRWPKGVTCPACSATEVSFIKTRRIWQCLDCGRQFSAKLGTIFEDSALGLDKWLPALWMLANCKNGISSYELARALHVTQKTAWFMLHRVRDAMRPAHVRRFKGEVEADEGYIGGQAFWMHKSEKKRRITKRGWSEKTPVVGLVKRGKNGRSRVSAKVLSKVTRAKIEATVKAHVATGATLYTDDASYYDRMDRAFRHEVINHTAKSFVEGRKHTNTVENFWSLLKRAIKGTYISVDPFHLQRYVDEQAFRYNTRKDNDGGRFAHVLRAIVGKRLTYHDLIGAKFSFATT
jgi:transposase-like protein